MSKFTSTLLRTTALIALMAIAQPMHAAFAQSDSEQTTATDPSPGDHSNVMPSASPQTQPVMAHSKGAIDVEKRIKTLHDKLKITAAEENDWAAVAATMRDNETTMYQLIQQRHQNSQSMTAVDDLQSYQKIMQGHADGLTKMISSFQTLYNDMPEAQQKNADAVFGQYEGHGHGKAHAKKHSS